MACWESAKESVGNSKEKMFYADEEADVTDLPVDPDEVAPGASCLVIETGDLYMLKSTYDWAKVGG